MPPKSISAGASQTPLEELRALPDSLPGFKGASWQKDVQEGKRAMGEEERVGKERKAHWLGDSALVWGDRCPSACSVIVVHDIENIIFALF